MATKPGVNVEPFSGYELRIQKVANAAADKTGLGHGMSADTVPMINDDTLTAERDRLLAAAPAHFERRIDAFVAEAVRAYSDALLREIGQEAQRVEYVLEGRAHPMDRKLEHAARAQDIAALATRVYSRGAQYLTSTSNAGYDKAQKVAAEGAKYALSAFSLNSHTDEMQSFVDTGKIAEAVLGTMPAFRLIAALNRGAFKVTHFDRINQNVVVTLDPQPDDAPFSPPMLVGWTYPDLEYPDNGDLRAVARSILFVVLPDRQHSGILRERTNERLTQILNAGSFALENDSRGRVNDYPAMLLRTSFGSGYGATPTYMRAVPLGDFFVKHVTRAEGAPTMNDYLDMLTRSHGYRYATGSKSDAVGNEIGRAKNGAIKWISPDPFAKG